METKPRSFDFTTKKHNNMQNNKESETSVSGTGSKPMNNDSKTKNVRTILCPYCQEEIAVNAFLFRAQDPEDDEKLSRKRDDLSEEEYNERLLYVAKPDERLIEFWSDDMMWKNSINLRELEYGYSEFFTKKKAYTDGSVLNNAEEADSNQTNMAANDDNKMMGTAIADVKCCILTEDLIQKKVIKDGYLMAVVDGRGKKTTKKICPHCHCLLPDEYGLHKVRFISCIGKRTSGKTVLLSKFFEIMGERLPKVAGVLAWSKNSKIFFQNRLVKQGVPLPEPTGTENFKPPVFVEIGKSDEHKDLFVFYDIAGENCVSPEKMLKLGKFIKNSDGILMLVSKDQILDAKEKNNTNILAVLECIRDTFGSENRNIPFAVVLSKSDQYFSMHPAPEGISKDVIYRKKGYMIKQHENLHTALYKMLEETALLNYVHDLFPNAKFFAVSALGAEPVDDVPEKQIVTKRLEEPFMWLLYKFNMIEKVTDSTWDVVCALFARLQNFIKEQVTGRH